MFQTQLPSGRRRLFVFLLILFTIIVFGMRYLLLALGWVEKQTDSTSKQTTEQMDVESSPNANQPTFTSEQLMQARQTAENFLKRYTQRDLAQSQVWFRSFANMLSPKYAEELRMEAEHSRPTVLVKEIKFQTIKRSTCHPNHENVSCHLEVTTEEVDAQDRSTLVDKNYEVILSLQNGNWKVEGLNIYGSLD